MYLKLEICVVCKEFLVFEYLYIIFFRNKSDDYFFICTSDILKLVFKTSFSVLNIHLYLCGQVENIDIVLSKNDVFRCAVFKISDVQILIILQGMNSKIIDLSKIYLPI